MIVCVCVFCWFFLFVCVHVRLKQSYEDRQDRFGGPKGTIWRSGNRYLPGPLPMVARRNRRKSGLGAISGLEPFQDRSARCQSPVLDDFLMLFGSPNRTRIKENQRTNHVGFLSQTKTVFERSVVGFW